MLPLLVILGAIDGTNWVKDVTLGGIFAFYLFYHEPKERDKEHRRRMAEINAIRGVPVYKENKGENAD